MLEREFQPLAEIVGVEVDQVRYIAMLLCCYPFALLFRHFLHPSHTPLFIRHAVSALLGLIISAICFDSQVLVIVGMVGFGYLLLLILPSHIVQRWTMVYVVICITLAHLYRTLTDYGNSSQVDFTTPLMLLVQKLSLVAYAVHDGSGNSGPLNQDQKKHKLDSVPSVLEYFGYCFNFHTMLAGPSMTMREHLSFIDGSNFTQHTPPSHGDSKQTPKEPSALYPVLSKFLIAIGIYAVHYCLSYYSSNIVLLATDPSYSFPEHLLYTYLGVFSLRCRYHLAWMLAESVCNAAGLGFDGYDTLGRPKWDLASNVFVVRMELAMNMRAVTNGWNVRSSLWLRRVCYERVTWYPALLTFMLSAYWHGFYPGYYFTFLSLGLALEASKRMRRLLNHYFTSKSLLVEWSYHLATFFLTRIYVTFVATPLALLWLSDTLAYWSACTEPTLLPRSS